MLASSLYQFRPKLAIKPNYMLKSYNLDNVYTNITLKGSAK